MNPNEFLPFLKVALDGMLGIASTFGDDRVNETPDLEGANSPYVILHHCIGVADWWIGAMIGGRDVVRDRDAEFTASGSVADLAGAVADLEARLLTDLRDIDPGAPIRHPERLREGSSARTWTQSAALIHTLEELAQHHGQMELTRDILNAGT